MMTTMLGFLRDAVRTAGWAPTSFPPDWASSNSLPRSVGQQGIAISRGTSDDSATCGAVAGESAAARRRGSNLAADAARPSTTPNPTHMSDRTSRPLNIPPLLMRDWNLCLGATLLERVYQDGAAATTCSIDGRRLSGLAQEKGQDQRHAARPELLLRFCRCEGACGKPSPSLAAGGLGCGRWVRSWRDAIPCPIPAGVGCWRAWPCPSPSS